jgi:hypothetical protein
MFKLSDKIIALKDLVNEEGLLDFIENEVYTVGGVSPEHGAFAQDEQGLLHYLGDWEIYFARVN